MPIAALGDGTRVCGERLEMRTVRSIYMNTAEEPSNCLGIFISRSSVRRKVSTILAKLSKCRTTSSFRPSLERASPSPSFSQVWAQPTIYYDRFLLISSRECYYAVFHDHPSASGRFPSSRLTRPCGPCTTSRPAMAPMLDSRQPILSPDLNYRVPRLRLFCIRRVQ
jgi:hypothetical protein